MKNASFIVGFEEYENNEPICYIHHELHTPSIINENFSFKGNKFSFKVYIFPIDINSISYQLDIFKPPKDLT